MTTIVAAVFETDAAADRAADELHKAGFGAREVEKFVLTPPGQHHDLITGGDEAADPKAKGGEKGAAAGAAVGAVLGAVAGLAGTPLVGPAAIAGGMATGAYVGSMAGAVNTMKDEPASTRAMARPPGVMLAVPTDAGEDEEVAVDLMREAGARMIERADGTWQGGRWIDFDPVRPPQVIEQRPV
jgi:hypothetical protein